MLLCDLDLASLCLSFLSSGRRRLARCSGLWREEGGWCLRSRMEPYPPQWQGAQREDYGRDVDKPTLLGAQPNSVKTDSLQPGLFLAGELSHRGLVAWFEEWPPKLPGPRPPGYGGFHALDRVYGCEGGSQTSRQRGIRAGLGWSRQPSK